VPFPDPKERAKHFIKHGHKFGAADEFEYERMADAFMTAPAHPNLYEGVRATASRAGSRDRFRLDAITLHFGIAYGVLELRTYHIRDPHGIAMHGGPAGFIAHKCAEVK
jgi:hypothetical protein